MTTVLRTARVALREFTDADLNVLAMMVADEDQMRFYPAPRTRADAEAWIDRNISLYKTGGYGFWLMEAIEGGDFVGYCGIRPLTIEGVQEVELGWHIRKELWVQGLATEAAAACRDHAFGRFDIQRLVATIDPSHAASVRVAEKIGMRPEKTALLEGWACMVYSLGSLGSAERHLRIGKSLR